MGQGDYAGLGYPFVLTVSFDSFPEVCGKFLNPRAHRLFRAEKPQVKALRHPGVLGMFRICRILPVFAFAAAVSTYILG